VKLEYLVAIGVRLFSIGLAIYILNMLSNFSFLWENVGGLFAKTAYFGSVLAISLLAIFLWKFPLTVARSISNFPALEPKELDKEAYIKLLEVGLILIGFYLLFYTISDGIYWLTFYWQIMGGEYLGSNVSLRAEDKSSMIATCFELILGAYLIFGHKALARIVLKLRRA
jgi:hypothetical protein